MSPSTPPVSECLTRKPHPGALRVRRAPRTPPGSSPSAPAREPPTPGTRRVRHVSPGVFLFSRILENTQKIGRTLEMHNKSNFDPKNVIPIFMALYCSVIPRKNNKPGKKTKMPLGKSREPKLYLNNSGRFLWPKLNEILPVACLVCV